MAGLERDCPRITVAANGHERVVVRGGATLRDLLKKVARREATNTSALIRRVLMEYIEDHHQDLAYEAEGLLESQDDE